MISIWTFIFFYSFKQCRWVTVERDDPIAPRLPPLVDSPVFADSNGAGPTKNEPLRHTSFEPSDTQLVGRVSTLFFYLFVGFGHFTVLLQAVPKWTFISLLGISMEPSKGPLCYDLKHDREPWWDAFHSVRRWPCKPRVCPWVFAYKNRKEKWKKRTWARGKRAKKEKRQNGK